MVLSLRDVDDELSDADLEALNAAVKLLDEVNARLKRMDESLKESHRALTESLRVQAAQQSAQLDIIEKLEAVVGLVQTSQSEMLLHNNEVLHSNSVGQFEVEIHIATEDLVPNGIADAQKNIIEDVEGPLVTEHDDLVVVMEPDSKFHFGKLIEKVNLIDFSLCLELYGSEFVFERVEQGYGDQVCNLSSLTILCTPTVCENASNTYSVCPDVKLPSVLRLDPLGLRHDLQLVWLWLEKLPSWPPDVTRHLIMQHEFTKCRECVLLDPDDIDVTNMLMTDMPMPLVDVDPESKLDHGELMNLFIQRLMLLLLPPPKPPDSFLCALVLWCFYIWDLELHSIQGGFPRPSAKPLDSISAEVSDVLEFDIPADLLLTFESGNNDRKLGRVASHDTSVSHMAISSDDQIMKVLIKTLNFRFKFELLFVTWSTDPAGLEKGAVEEISCMVLIKMREFGEGYIGSDFKNVASAIEIAYGVEGAQDPHVGSLPIITSELYEKQHYNLATLLHQWEPSTLKRVRSFLDVVGDYCCIVRDYAELVISLVELLHKYALIWSVPAADTHSQNSDGTCMPLNGIFRKVFGLLCSHRCLFKEQPKAESFFEDIHNISEKFEEYCIKDDLVLSQNKLWVPTGTIVCEILLYEYYYNTAPHSSLRCSSFKAAYGHVPPRLKDYELGSTTLAKVQMSQKANKLSLQGLRMESKGMAEMSQQSGDYYYVHFSASYTLDKWPLLHKAKTLSFTQHQRWYLCLEYCLSVGAVIVACYPSEFLLFSSPRPPEESN